MDTEKLILSAVRNLLTAKENLDSAYQKLEDAGIGLCSFYKVFWDDALEVLVLRDGISKIKETIGDGAVGKAEGWYDQLLYGDITFKQLRKEPK